LAPELLAQTKGLADEFHSSRVSAVGEAIEQGPGQALVLEDLHPIGEGQVGRDDHGHTLIQCGTELEHPRTCRCGAGVNRAPSAEKGMKPSSSSTINFCLSARRIWQNLSSMSAWAGWRGPWMALDDASPANGRLWYLPGTQREATFELGGIGENFKSLAVGDVLNNDRINRLVWRREG
jgi:hypothetical protein